MYTDLDKKRSSNRQWYANHKNDPQHRAKNRAKARKHQNNQRALVGQVAMYYGCQNPNCPCKSFGYTPEELDFHHTTSKSFVVSQSMSRSKRHLAQEINKCIVLCANCHRRVHAERFGVEGMRLCHVDDTLRPMP